MEANSIQKEDNFYWEDANGKFTMSNGKYTVVIDKGNRDEIFKVLKENGFAKEDKEFVGRMLKEREEAGRGRYECPICKEWHGMGEHVRIG